MKQLFIFDGVDNAGKTWVVNEVSRRLNEPHTLLKFPSKELLEADLTLRSLKETDFNTKSRYAYRFVSELLIDIDTKLSNSEDTVLIDRLNVSTLLYQGKYLSKEYINARYQELFQKHNILPFYLLFPHPFPAVQRDGLTEAQVLFDSKNEEIVSNMRVFLRESDLYGIYTFNSLILNNDKAQSIPELQEQRVAEIMRFI